MATSTKRPNTISQTTGSYASGKYYRSWYNLSNLKVSDKWADCGKSGTLIGGKNGTYPRPAPLKLTNFKFSIPSTAKISKITVYYRHYKSKVSGAYGSFNAPTIDLLNVSASAKKGSAVPTSSTEYSVSWSLSPSVSKVNSSSFGVSINYPANTNTNPDIIHLRNVRIVITYTNAVSSSSAVTNINLGGGSSGYISQSDMSNANGRIIVVGSDGSISYADNQSQAVDMLTNNSPKVSQTGANVSKSKVYLGETVDITLTISASSKITATTRMYITMPEGVELIGKKSGNGTIEQGITNESQDYENDYWTANFSNTTTVSITFTVQINSIGTKTFKFRETTTDKLTIVQVISEEPQVYYYWGDSKNLVNPGENMELIIKGFCLCGEPVEKSFSISFPSEGIQVSWEDDDFTVASQNNVYTITKTFTSGENSFKCNVSFANEGTYTITSTSESNTITRNIKVKPTDLTLPYFAKIVADEHILDRLGNSKEYTLSSFMQLVVDSNKESLIEAYDYNYRLGVFNTNLPEDSAQNYVNLIDTNYWRELESRATTATIEDNGIKGDAVCVFGSNVEFTNSNYYSLTFEFTLTGDTRVGFLLFGDPSSTITNKYSWYGIITDIGYTFLESYAQDGTPSNLYNGSKNFFRTGVNDIRIIRESNRASIYINDELFYTLNNLSDCHNTIGFQKWGSGSAKISNINLSSDIGDLNNYMLENAEWSQPISTPNAWEDIKVNFHYSEEYPLIFLISGEYIEHNAEDISLQYTYPCLIEEDYRQFAENPGIFEYPIKDITTIEGATSLDLHPGQVTNIVKLYDIDLTNFLESDEDNCVVQGVSVLFDVLSCDNPISIMCKLVSPSFPKEGTRSLNIESEFSEEGNSQYMVNLGGSFDLWGLDFDDFKLSSLEDLTIDLQFLNNYEQATHIEFNNLCIVFYYVDLEESKIIAKVNGVDLRYLNVFIKDAVIKPGTNNDVKYLDVEGTDSNLAYRSNIREKEIEMEIRVPGCDIEETTAFVERLGKLLTNKRNKFNKPILNEIEFNHHPNRVWPYILEDELDLSAEFTEYEGKIKLIVPSGTAYSKEPIVTNATGTNSGLAKVNPIIRIIAQDTGIVVKETISNQEWRLNDSTLSVGDLIHIDCSERKAYKVTVVDGEEDEEGSDDSPVTDITDKVDFNSDWFLLHEDYNFECENTALIQSVSFYERW